MASDETRKEQFKRRLHNKSDEDIWLELDTRTIDLTWKRSLAKQELTRRERESDLAKAKQRIAELETEVSGVRTDLSSARSGSVWMRWQTISGWLVAALMLLLALFL